MAHVATDVIHDGWTGSRSLEDPIPEISVQYVVRVDDQEDGPNFILKHCKLPRPGEFYTGIGNDNFGFAICKSVNVSPLGEKTWRATAKYSAPDPDDDEMLDEDDNPTDDPSKQGLDVGVSLVQMSKAAEAGDYIKGWNKATGNMLVAFPGGPAPGATNVLADAITNSAMGVFDPPPEVDYSRVSVTITRNQRRFNATKLLPYNDTVNKDRIRLRFGGPGGDRFKLNIERGEAKMQSIGAARSVSSEGLVYWRVSFEFHIEVGKGRDAWRSFILDRGYGHSASFNPSTGGSYSPVVGAGMAPVPIVTPAGHTNPEPVLLDGAGGPLAVGAAPVFLVYQLYKERAWAPLKLNNLGWEF